MSEIKKGSAGSKRSHGTAGIRYAIVTPARNEESNIGRTLQSMVKQTVRPVRWVIVDDGSSDSTAAIVKEYSRKYDFITLATAEGASKACFGSKVNAFRAGYQYLEDLDYDYIGNLDGDVSFAPDYFETLLGRMENQKKIGLAGGIILEEIKGRFIPQRISSNSVAGAVQCFRRNCYEEFGGYIPIDIGGIDSMAEILVRGRGWDVHTFDDLLVHHHGRVTTGARNVLATRFKKGRINHALGYHPLFHVCIGFSRILQRPYVFGGLLMIAGYVWAGIRGDSRHLPPESVEFLRKEQMNRLRGMIGLRKVR